MYGTHALLHISVILFFWAIGEFFYIKSITILASSSATHSGCQRLSMRFSASLSLFISNSPYNLRR